MNVLVVSPHRDDAVWSMGATIAAALSGATLATVYAGAPTKGLLTTCDRQAGFDSSAEATAERHAENVRACTILNVIPVDGGFKDSQYGEPHATEPELVAWLNPLVVRFDVVYSPVGLGHPDHRMSAGAVRVAAAKNRIRNVVYEEIPYRVWFPEEAVTCLDEIRASGWNVTPASGLPVPDGKARAAKAAASECYRSQLDPAIRACLAVPERLWDLSWPD